MRRSKISMLPKEVKAWLDQSLIEGNFAGYELLEKELSARGCTIGKSSLHRYGQQFEQRLQALKMASEQAKAIVQASPDDEGAVSEALMRLVQEKLFQSLIQIQINSDDPISLASAAKSVAELSRATVTQKKWQAEVRIKIRAEERAKAAEQAASAAKDGGASPEVISKIRDVLGIK